MMTEEAERTVKSVVKETTTRINQRLLEVETVTRNFAWVVGEHLENPDAMYRITRKLVENNELIAGSVIAFEPGFYKAKGRLYAPCSYVSTNGQVRSLLLQHEYPAQEWYRATKEGRRARWCEPYFDEGGGDVMMCTFSVPLTNKTGQVYAVLTADVSLSGMDEYIGGSAVAFVPDFYKEKGRLYAPYTCASTNGQLKSFPLPYDYSSREWYDEAKTSGQARWCEPYFDEGGGEVMMCTFSVPLTNETGKVYAVLTADVSLLGMAEYISSICPYPQSYAVMTSCAGKYLVEPPQGRTLERNEKAIAIREKTDNGWGVAIICPLEDILKETRRLVSFVVLFAVIGLLIIIPVSWIHITRLQRESVVRDWVANKLETAADE